MLNVCGCGPRNNHKSLKSHMMDYCFFLRVYLFCYDPGEYGCYRVRCFPPVRRHDRGHGRQAASLLLDVDRQPNRPR